MNEKMLSAQLIASKKKSKVLRSSRTAVTASVRTCDFEETASKKHVALRLLCRAMIRLYLNDSTTSTNGKGLGIL